MKNGESATVAIVNGRIFTANPDTPTAEAVAMRDGSIIAVGSNIEIDTVCNSDTVRIDGRGRTVMPGFADAHFHLEWGSKTLIGAQLYGIDTLLELKRAVHSWLAENQDAPWVLGQGGSYALPSSSVPLTRHMLDDIVADRPLVITAFDMHSMFVNTAALRAAAIFDHPPQNLDNGAIPIGEDGLPTGELYEMDAMDLIHRALPEPTLPQKITQTREGLALAAANGITSMHNMDGDVAQAELYAVIEDQGLLTARISMPYWVKPNVDIDTMITRAQEMTTRFETDFIHCGRVKFFMDGVYESYTAVSLSGYPDQPDNYGDPLWSRERFAAFATAADAAGLQIATHACGDGAVRRVLDGYEAAEKTNGQRDSRHRVEHIEMIAPEDISRFAQLGVTASMQPLHAPLQTNDPDVWATRIIPNDYPRAFAWRDLRLAEATVVFGSDWPVVTLNPLVGIWGAVNRRPFRPGAPDHRQTITEALHSYTSAAAWADFQEEKVGKLKPGLAADIVILSDDIFEINPEEIGQMKIDTTIFNGRIVFQRD